ncbi:hypothetical protein ACF0H5_023685 [Mactra antiquata]
MYTYYYFLYFQLLTEITGPKLSELRQKEMENNDRLEISQMSCSNDVESNSQLDNGLADTNIVEAEVSGTNEELTSCCQNNFVAGSSEGSCIENNADNENTATKYKCPVCLKLYSFKKSFEFHVKTQHSADKFKCTFCDKTFKIKNDLDRHVNIHKGVRPYPCPECEKSFICRSSLNRHRKLQHLIGDIYKCHVCDKSFRVEQDLNRHLLTHTGVRPWSCDLCSKSFTCKSSLNVHKRSHDDSKKLCCQFCQKRFHIKMDLVRHETLHTGDRQWGCAVCSKRYSGKSALKRHIKDVHFLRKVKSQGSQKLANDNIMDILKESQFDSDVIDSFIVFKGDNLDVSEEN